MAISGSNGGRHSTVGMTIPIESTPEAIAANTLRATALSARSITSPWRRDRHVGPSPAREPAPKSQKPVPIHS